jgi:hypothetical protein
MQLPIDITFKMLAWRADLHLTDRTGRVVGYVPSSQVGHGRMPIYADQSMGRPIYTIRAETPLAHWFQDAAGQKIGEFGPVPTEAGKLVIVGGKPRYRFVSGSEWVDFLDRLMPNLPVLNGLTGAIIRPRTLAVRIGGGAKVLSIVRTRKMVDICYSVDAIEAVGDSERECLLLSALVYAWLDHGVRTIL